jgi:hypothetical protein
MRNRLLSSAALWPGPEWKPVGTRESERLALLVEFGTENATVG